MSIATIASAALALARSNATRLKKLETIVKELRAQMETDFGDENTDDSTRSSRVLIAYDGEDWFVRRIALSVQDDIRGELVYHCDKHLGGPFKTAEEALKAATR